MYFVLNSNTKSARYSVKQIQIFEEAFTTHYPTVVGPIRAMLILLRKPNRPSGFYAPVAMPERQLRSLMGSCQEKMLSVGDFFVADSRTSIFTTNSVWFLLPPIASFQRLEIEFKNFYIIRRANVNHNVFLSVVSGIKLRVKQK